MIIIHIGVNLGLLSIIVISHVWYASIITIILIDPHLVIFYNGE